MSKTTPTSPKGAAPLASVKSTKPGKTLTASDVAAMAAMPNTSGLDLAKATYVPAPVHPIPESADPRLVHILAWPRKHNSASEATFQVWLAAELAQYGTVLTLEEGALSLEVKRADGSQSTTLFSCHTDTIDPLVPDAANPLAKKKLTYDPNFGEIALDTTSVGGSLGADDGAGVWIMLGMIEAKVPGVYLFHRGEECGGISAKAIASKQGKWLATFEACIAFDRGRTRDVVTHQGGLQCASMKFADKLCAQLNVSGFDFAPSTGGTYTDNKEYRRIIAEVVNVSVGYECQHGRNETLDYAHVHALRAACLTLDWDALPIDRDPAKPDPVYTPPARTSYYGGTAKKWGTADLWDGKDDDYEGWGINSKDKPKAAVKPAVKATAHTDDIAAAQLMSSEDLLWMATEGPEVIHELIVALLRENARLKADVASLENLLGL